MDSLGQTVIENERHSELKKSHKEDVRASQMSLEQKRSNLRESKKSLEDRKSMSPDARGGVMNTLDAPPT